MKDFPPQLKATGLLPVIGLTSEAECHTLMRALLSTPVRCVEITLRHPYAAEAISLIKKDYSEFTVGAGTVVSPKLLALAAAVGADFCVAPGFDEELLDLADRQGLPFVPGCSIPTEIQKAAKRGLHTVKFFPAACMGGTQALKLYEGAFAGMSFLPTGGITKENLALYAACPNVLACGGSFMAPKELLKAGNEEGIRRTVLSCLTAIKEATL